METDLSRVIQQIRSNRSLLAVDEASTKAGAVLPLLHALGWNPFDVEEVKPEYATGSKRVDYALRISNVIKVFIEVKRMTDTLEPHQEQLLEYCFQEGVKLAILTNGATWWFYLPLNEVPWEQRRFYSVDLLEQEPAQVADRFVEFLAKERVKSGEAQKSAETIYKSQQKKQILRVEIPRAWQKIISEPDDLFVDLLIETTEKISGFRPEISDIERFLTEDLQKSIPPTFIPTGATLIGSGSPLPPTSLPVSYINKKILHFIFLGKKYNPKNWQDVLLTVATELYRKHKTQFQKCLVLRGPKMAYFSKNPSELMYPKRIADSDYYAEAKLNSNSIVRRSRELMLLFGYSEADLKIEAV